MLHYLFAFAACVAAIDVDWRRDMPVEERTAEVERGEKINFKWAGWHNVYRMKSCTENFRCPSGDQGAYQVASVNVKEYSYTVKDSDPGLLCYYCQVYDGHHCRSGQYLVVKVKGEASKPVSKPESKPIYLNWFPKHKMKQLTAKPGQKIMFSWAKTKNHNVVRAASCDASMWNNFKCPASKKGALEANIVDEKKIVVVNVPTDGKQQYLCYYCGVGNHCNGGQHVVVKVAGAGDGNGAVGKPGKGDKAGKKAGKKDKKAGKKDKKKGKGEKKGRKPKGKDKGKKKGGKGKGR